MSCLIPYLGYNTPNTIKEHPIKAFEKFNLHPAIIKALSTQGYDHATAIQSRVIPAAMKGMDVIGASKSGTGKTAAYILPLLNKLNKVVKAEHKVLRAIIIVPTIELADQVSRTLVTLSKHIDIMTVKVQGGSHKSTQISRLKQGADIVVATPGRLQDFIANKKINLEFIDTVILDEADTMLELGFLGDIKRILQACKRPRQTLMFSATISQNIKKLAKEFLRDPAIVEVSDRRDVVDFIKHRAYKVDRARKAELTTALIKESHATQILLFTTTKASADTIFAYLKSQDIWTAVIHGDLSRGARAKALSLLKSGKTQVLVATDIAARGIDIPELPLVINYDFPEGTDDFTHRVGRTGRAQHKGAVITLLTIRDYNKFSKIEKDLKLNIKREIHPEFALTDTQPRQSQPRKKSLREKKGYIDKDKKRQQAYAKKRPKKSGLKKR
jgi:ATP-dependent RNA helicase RhlE